MMIGIRSKKGTINVVIVIVIVVDDNNDNDNDNDKLFLKKLNVLLRKCNHR